MAQKDIVQNGFTGGITNSRKVGLPDSFGFSRNLNIFEDASYMIPNPQTILSSGSTVTDLPLWIVDTVPYTNSDKWAYDASGNLYRTDGVGLFWNLQRAGSTIGHGAAGQGLIVFDNALYYATATTIGRGIPLNLGVGAIVYNDDFLSDGITNLNSSQTASGQTYTTPTTIIENAGNSLFFKANYSPIQQLAIVFGTKGTGTLQVTIHDSNNNTVLFHDVDSADLPASGPYAFTFDSPWFPIIGETYHFHLTSTVADATVQTGTSNDLSTVDYRIYFNILIQSDFHPMEQFLNGIVIGNYNYLATWDGAIYNPNRIAIESGYIIQSITQDNEFLVIGAWRGGSTNRAADAKLYYWDGIEPTFNYSKPIEMGFPNAITSSKNRLFGVYGTSGKMYLNADPFQLIRQIPKLPAGKNITIAPGAITEFQERTAVGFGIDTDDTTQVSLGVYEWGSKSDEFPEVMNFGYTISTGHTHNIKIGAVKAFGNDLYIGWQDDNSGTTFGIDKVNTTNNPFTEMEWYTLIFDNDQPQKPKYADMLVIEFEGLSAGETVTPKYAIDANAFTNTFTLGTMISGTGSKKAVLPIGKRFNSLSFGFNATTVDTFLKITGVYFYFDDLALERGF